MKRAFWFLVWLVLRACAHFCPRDTIWLDGRKYMTRYYLRGTPGCKGDTVRLQCIHVPDSDRTPHDHPWFWAHSRILRGSYAEARRRDYQGEAGTRVFRLYGPGDENVLVNYTATVDVHRITSVTKGGCWTLFTTSVQHGRGWGAR